MSGATSEIEFQKATMDGVDNPSMLECEPDSEDFREPIGNNMFIEMNNLGKVILVDKRNTYNPYVHRHIKHSTSFAETWVHLMKASLGTGILAMPNAFRNAGYAVGTIGTILVGFLCTYCIHLLTGASHRLCIKKKVPSMSYPDTVLAAFEEGPAATKKLAPYARTMTIVFLVLYQIGTSCVYIVFISSNVKSLVDKCLSKNLDLRIYMVYLIFPLTAISLVKNLKLLAPFSSVATGLTSASLLIIFYYIFRERLSFVDRQAVGTFQGVSSFFGTVLFAMEAIGVILPLENQMTEPTTFSKLFGVLNCAMLPVTLLYNFVGLSGHLKYGNDTKSTITLNIPQNEKLSSIAKIFLSLSIYVNYALSNFVTFDIIWELLDRKLGKHKHKKIIEFTLRIVIVLVTFCLAIMVPNLEYLISLIGATCLSMVGILLPTVVHFLTGAERYRHKGRVQYGLFVMRNVSIVFVSVFAFVVGVTTSSPSDSVDGTI